VFDRLARYRGQFKLWALEVILLRADIEERAQEIHAHLVNNDILGLLRYTDEAIQLTTLKILSKVIKVLTSEQIKQFLGTAISSFPSHQSMRCRVAFYDLFAWLYDHRCTTSKSKHNQAAPAFFDDETTTAVKRELLKGLTDDSELIRVKMMDFWNKNSRMPQETMARIEFVLKDLYVPEVEHFYLNYATSLLLETTRNGKDFLEKAMAGAQNDKAVAYSKRPLDLSWHHQAMPMMPMFAQTQSSQEDYLSVYKNIFFLYTFF